MSDFIGDLGRGIRWSAHARVEDAFVDGFNEAAHIAVAALTQKIDGLAARMAQAASSPASQDQFVLVALTQLKSEIEAELRRYFEDER